MQARPQNRERGQALIFVTLSLVVTMGMLGLVVDIGWANWRKLACRSAAETAAAAAAKTAVATHTFTAQGETLCPATPSAGVPWQVGCLYAAQNGFAGGGRTVRMAAGTASPPPGGVAPTFWVSATASETIPTWFSRALGRSSITVRARATAGVFATPNGCIYVLNQTASEALRMTGTSSIESGCGVFVNSGDSQAVRTTGTADIHTTNGAKTYIHGQWSHTGISSIDPAPIEGAAIVADPFENMPEPSDAGSCQPDVHLTGTTTRTISAGKYCSQITLTGTSSLTLGPGIYYLQGGLDMSGTSSIQATGGVLLYIASGSVNMSGTATMSLSAQTSGPYRGVLMWQSKNDTSDAVLTGTSDQAVTGAIYFPKAHLTYHGTSSTLAVTTTIAADTLEMTGTSNILAPASTPYAGGSPGVALIE